MHSFYSVQHEQIVKVDSEYFIQNKTIAVCDRYDEAKYIASNRPGSTVMFHEVHNRMGMRQYFHVYPIAYY